MTSTDMTGGRSRPVIEQWGRIQNSLAQVTGFSFTTIGAGGRVLTQSGDAALCRLLAEQGAAGKGCSDQCLESAERARRENRVHFFRCRAGLQCFAAPIHVEGHGIAAILGGRILESAPDPDFFHALARERGIDEDKVLKAVGQLPLDNARTLARIAELVEQTGEVLFASAYSHSRARKRLTLLNSLFHLGTDLTPEKDPHEIYALIVNTVSILFDVEGACLFLSGGGEETFRAKTFFGSAREHCADLELNRRQGLAAEVVKRRSPSVTSDYHRILGSGFPEGVRSTALFPLLFGETVRGMLLIVNTRLDRDSVRLIFSFCNQASTAIQNTILKHELKQKVTEATRLVRVQNRFGPILDHDSLLEAIFDEATTMTGAEQASLMMLNRKTNELVVKLAKGEHSPVIRKVALTPGEGIAGKVLQSGEPVLVEDLEKDGRFRSRRRPRYRSGSFLIIPLMTSNRIVGVLNLADKAGGVFSREDLEGLLAVFSQASIALQRSELYGMTRELQRISTTDPLTQLLNRRYFQRRSQEEILRAQRYNSPLSLVMLDLDDFKRYNDTHGHIAGDSLLVSISRTIREAVRSIDVVSRFGGEEFAILSPHTESGEAIAVAERVREAVQCNPFPLGGQQPLGLVSVSAGVATYPEHAGSLQELLDNADRALYRAKGAGKNQVFPFDLV